MGIEADPVPATLTQQQFRDAMCRLGAAVHIVTTNGVAGRCGFTASAVCSVSADPATLLVCMNRSSQQHAAFRENGVLCVNTLAAHQMDISKDFAGGEPSMAKRFSRAEWTRLETGAPVLEEALVAFDTIIESANSIGTHDVLFCRVLAARMGSSADALIYFYRDYHQIAS